MSKIILMESIFNNILEEWQATEVDEIEYTAREYMNSKSWVERYNKRYDTNYYLKVV